MIFFKRSQHSTSSAAMFLMAAALGSRLLGLLRDRLLAAHFGAGEELDIYFAAFRIPDLLYNVMLAGAFVVAFIPVFLEVRRENEERAWQMTQNVFTITSLALIVVSAVSALAMPLLVRMIAPGFEGEKYELTVLLSRIMLLSPLLLGASTVFSGVTQALHKFWPYAVAPLLYNVGIIAGILFFLPQLGLPGLAWGVALGALAHMIIQFVGAYHAGFRFAFLFSPSRFEFFRLVRLMVPRSLALVLWQFNILATTALASLLASGSVSVFNLANNLQYLVIGIVGISYATVSLPSFYDSYAESPVRAERSREETRYINTILQLVRQILFVALPLSALLFVLRAQLVRVALGAGVFSWQDTRLTAAVLGIFCFGLFAHSIIPTLARAFYAAHDSWTPVWANAVGVSLNITVSVFLTFFFLQDGAAESVSSFLHISDLPNAALMGLPIAFVISGIVTLAILLWQLFVQHCPGVVCMPVVRDLALSFLRMTVLSLGAGYAAYGVLRLLLIIPLLDTQTFWGIFAQGAGAGMVGIAAYLGAIFFLRLPERNFAWELLSLGMRTRATHRQSLPADTSFVEH